PGQPQPGQPQPGQSQPGQSQPGQAPPGQAQPGQAPPGQAPPGHTPPGHTPAGQVPPGQSADQSRPGRSRLDQAAPGQARPARDTARVIRRAAAPAPRPPAENGEDDQDEDVEHFVPPHPPPLPHLDPVAKGAWLALLGGPAYLLTASMAGWYVPGWAALAAVVAFVAGFAVIVIRLGDGPSRGAGPDNGAIL
ncbi:MAG TPA: hypothetical protein VH637_10495, partial [Streptosporangiaceae bacterium]